MSSINPPIEETRWSKSDPILLGFERKLQFLERMIAGYEKETNLLRSLTVRLVMRRAECLNEADEYEQAAREYLAGLTPSKSVQPEKPVEIRKGRTRK